MQVLIIFAHPSQESFTFKILGQLVKGLREAKHQVEISDLYALHFKAEMTEEEYKREGLGKADTPVAADVAAEQHKVNQADCVIFLYPVWWSDCPAILKGWFDRVYSLGFAYSKEEGRARKMKALEKGLVLCTAGHPNNFLEETGIAESMRKIMVEDRLGNRFNHREMIILGGTLTGNEQKVQLLEKAFQIGRAF